MVVDLVMLNSYKILTITYRNTNLQELGHFVVQNTEGPAVADKLRQIKENFGLTELFYLSTCNRVMYFFVHDQVVDDAFIYRFFRQVNPELTPEKLDEAVQITTDYQGEEALSHLFEVAASIDSMVIGERQILRQLRKAYESSHQWGLTGDSIRLAINFAVETAKKVYANTRIGEKPVSVVSLAIQKLLAAQLPKNAKILLIGAGQTNTLVAKFLRKHQFNRVTVFNRDVSKARKLSGMLDGKALPLADLSSYESGFDALIVCTGSTEPIINKQIYQNLIGNDENKKLVIDLAIPNNVSREVLSCFDLNYIEIENIRALAKENLAFREKEVARVKTILQERLAKFHSEFQKRQIELAMHLVPQEIKAIKAHALNTVFRKEVDDLDEETRALVEKMMSYMEKRCISIPMKAAKNLVR